MYINQALLFGIHPIVVMLHSNLNATKVQNASDAWTLNFDEIEAAIDGSSVPVKGFILNTPHNPTGKVFTSEVRANRLRIILHLRVTIIRDGSPANVCVSAQLPLPVSLYTNASSSDSCFVEHAFQKLFNHFHFYLQEVRRIADICIKRNIILIADEIYDHIIFGGRFRGCTGPHHTLMWSWGKPYRDCTLIGNEYKHMIDYREHTHDCLLFIYIHWHLMIVSVNSLSKMGSATGWRVGWMLSPPSLTAQIRAIHDNLVIQAPTPFQYAAGNKSKSDT